MKSTLFGYAKEKKEKKTNDTCYAKGVFAVKKETNRKLKACASRDRR